MPDLSEAIQSRVANDSDDNATAPNLERRRPKRKSKSPSNLKDYYVGSTAYTFGVAQINSEYNSNEDLTLCYPYPKCDTSTSASHTNFVYNTLTCEAQLDVNNNPNFINQTNFFCVVTPEISPTRATRPSNSATRRLGNSRTASKSGAYGSRKVPSSCAPRSSTTGLKLARRPLTLFEIYKWFCLLLLSLIFV